MALLRTRPAPPSAITSVRSPPWFPIRSLAELWINLRCKDSACFKDAISWPPRIFSLLCADSTTKVQLSQCGQISVDGSKYYSEKKPAIQIHRKISRETNMAATTLWEACEDSKARIHLLRWILLVIRSMIIQFGHTDPILGFRNRDTYIGWH